MRLSVKHDLYLHPGGRLVLLPAKLETDWEAEALLLVGVLRSGGPTINMVEFIVEFVKVEPGLLGLPVLKTEVGAEIEAVDVIVECPHCICKACPT